MNETACGFLVVTRGLSSAPVDPSQEAADVNPIGLKARSKDGPKTASVERARLLVERVVKGVFGQTMTRRDRDAVAHR